MQYLLGESLLTWLIETLKNSTWSLLVDTTNYIKFITLKKVVVPEMKLGFTNFLGVTLAHSTRNQGRCFCLLLFCCLWIKPWVASREDAPGTLSPRMLSRWTEVAGTWCPCSGFPPRPVPVGAVGPSSSESDIPALSTGWGIRQRSACLGRWWSLFSSCPLFLTAGSRSHSPSYHHCKQGK